MPLCNGYKCSCACHRPATEATFEHLADVVREAAERDESEGRAFDAGYLAAVTGHAIAVTFGRHERTSRDLLARMQGQDAIQALFSELAATYRSYRIVFRAAALRAASAAQPPCEATERAEERGADARLS